MRKCASVRIFSRTNVVQLPRCFPALPIYIVWGYLRTFSGTPFALPRVSTGCPKTPVKLCRNCLDLSVMVSYFRNCLETDKESASEYKMVDSV